MKLTDQAKKLIVISIFAGFIGDGIWQVIAKLGYSPALVEYFRHQGSVEAMFTAAGIMGILYTLYALTGLPFKIQYLAAYGIIIDLIARYTGIMPSLKTHYKILKNPVETALLAGAVPFILPLLVLKVLEPSTVLV
jgi:uncharacterized membrane protein